MNPGPVNRKVDAMTPVRTLIDVLYEGDRRALTSRANLGDHVPAPLDPEGSVMVGVRLPRHTVATIDQYADDNGMTRSEAIRYFIDYGVGIRT
jgi:hypothetical protein